MIDYQEELEQYQERIDELAKEKRYAERYSWSWSRRARRC